MRKRALIGVCGTVVLAQGCMLKLPGNLGDPSAWLPKPVTATAPTKPSAEPGTPTGASCEDRFARLDKDGNKTLSLDEWLKDKGGKGARVFLDSADPDRELSYDEFLASCGGNTATPRPATPRPATPPPIARPGCEGSFAQHDGDGDGQWTLDEFMAWEATRPRKARPCVEGVFISNNGGGLIAHNGGGIVAAGGGALIASRRQLLQLNNKGGGLISDQGGGLIANNARFFPNPCPPDDPAYRYAQFDHDGDGQVSAQEFCGGPGARPQPWPSYTPDVYPSGQPEPYPETCEDGFFDADYDGDGLVSRDEYTAQRAEGAQMVYQEGDRWISAPRPDAGEEFAKKDIDGDGYLSLDESCYGGPEPEPSDDPNEWCNFYKVDDDGDDQASWEEFLAWSGRNTFPPPSKEVVYADFSRRDFDQNFVLTRDEWCGEIVAPTPPPYPRRSPGGWNPQPSPQPSGDAQIACMQAFSAAQVPGQSWVSFDAYAQARVAQTRWIQAPTDEERRAQHQMWVDQAKPFDRDNDGRLSLAELGAFCGAGVSLGNAYRK